MRKGLAIIISLVITIMFSCNPTKRLQKTQPPAPLGDTSLDSTVEKSKIADTSMRHQTSDTSLAVKDSATLGKEVYGKIVNNKIVFTTFNAKVRVGYTDNNGSDEATAFVRVKKDSVIWMSLRGPLGIEGVRILVTRDSVKVINFLKKYVQYRGIDYIEQIAGLPLDFSALQDMLLGNPVFIDSNINSYTSNGTNSRILMSGKIFKHLAIISNNDYKIVESKLDAVNNINRKCDIVYSGYNSDKGVPFSSERKVLLTDEPKLDINLNFKQYAFDQPITFPFNYSESYRKL